MEGIQILKRIIEEEGNCCWACPAVCAECPLGRLTRYSGNGGFMSCVEALSIDGLSEPEADAKYKEAAIRKLADLEIDAVIQQD